MRVSRYPGYVCCSCFVFKIPSKNVRAFFTQTPHFIGSALRSIIIKFASVLNEVALIFSNWL